MLKSTFFLLVTSVFITLVLSSCSGSTPTETPTIKVIITDVVDKATGAHLDDFTLTFRKETPDGVVLSSEEFSNMVNMSTFIPADGSVRVFVVVEAPGYIRYSTAIRGKYYSDKFIEFLVEMTRLEEELS